jgi:uncharacterized SAM-binding protein YcdF (DUF218 family)
MSVSSTQSPTTTQLGSPLRNAKLAEEITAIVFGPVVEPVSCEVIFIFGGLDPGLWEWGARAYAQGLGRDVVVTGGYKPGMTDHLEHEARVIRRELIARGVPETFITYEDESTNTLENVLFAMRVYDFSTVSRVLAVCKCYGAGRQCRTLRRNLGPAVQVIPYPFDTRIRGQGPVITRANWMQDEVSRAFVYEQVRKIIRYGRLGHLEPIETMSTELTSLLQAQQQG